jgi:hypothetical protein
MMQVLSQASTIVEKYRRLIEDDPYRMYEREGVKKSLVAMVMTPQRGRPKPPPVVEGVSSRERCPHLVEKVGGSCRNGARARNLPKQKRAKFAWHRQPRPPPRVGVNLSLFTTSSTSTILSIDFLNSRRVMGTRRGHYTRDAPDTDLSRW